MLFPCVVGLYATVGGQNLPLCGSGTSLLSLACFWEEMGSDLAWPGTQAPVTKGLRGMCTCSLWICHGKCLEEGQAFSKL